MPERGCERSVTLSLLFYDIVESWSRGAEHFLLVDHFCKIDPLVVLTLKSGVHDETSELESFHFSLFCLRFMLQDSLRLSSEEEGTNTLEKERKVVGRRKRK